VACRLAYLPPDGKRIFDYLCYHDTASACTSVRSTEARNGLLSALSSQTSRRMAICEIFEAFQTSGYGLRALGTAWNRL